MRNATVKLATIALISATLVAAPAAAQSLHETHERVWMPAGKSQIVTWRMKGHKAEASQAHHQAGKHQYLPTRKAPTEEARRTQGNGTVGASE
jgi:Ni/Co efflux regulator RcnB